MGELMSSKEAARYLGVTLRFLRELRVRRRLPHYRLGYKTITYSREELDRYIRRSRINAIGEGEY